MSACAKAERGPERDRALLMSKRYQRLSKNKLGIVNVYKLDNFNIKITQTYHIYGLPDYSSCKTYNAVSNDGEIPIHGICEKYKDVMCYIQRE